MARDDRRPDALSGLSDGRAAIPKVNPPDIRRVWWDQGTVIDAHGDLPLNGETRTRARHDPPDADLIRRDGRWYSADAVRSAEAELARPPAAALRQNAP